MTNTPNKDSCIIESYMCKIKPISRHQLWFPLTFCILYTYIGDKSVT